MTLAPTEDEKLALVAFLKPTIEDDRYSLSLRLRPQGSTRFYIVYREADDFN